MRLFLLLTIAFIVYGSLYPFHFEITARAAHPLLTVWQGWPTEWDRFIYRDVVLNVVLYTPLGFAAAALVLREHSRAISAMSAIGLAFALSISMELIQVYEPGRDPSSLDVLTNSVGGAFGAAVAIVSERRMREFKLGKPRASGLILLALWALAEFYPLLPDIGRTHLQESLFSVVHLRNLRLVDVWLGTGGWLALGVAIEFACRRLRTGWLAALMLAGLCAQMAVAGRNLSAWEPVSAAMALLLWRFCPREARAKWCACILGSAIVLRQLQPFYFMSVPQSFSWMPFAATLESASEGSVAIIARKAFDYGAIIFVLRRLWSRYLPATATVAAVLGVTEAIQTYLPGRTPEITDPLLALLIGGVLAIGERRKADA